MSVASLGVLLALLSACGQQAQPPAEDGTPAGRNPVFGAVAFPADRASSGFVETQLNGSSAESHSPAAAPDGDAMVLPLTVQTEYAVYRFNTGGDAAASLSIQLASGSGGVYVGVANYASQRWEFKGFYTGETVPLDGVDYVSPASNVWIVLLVHRTAARIESLALQTVHPDPTAVITPALTGGTVPVTVAFTGYYSRIPSSPDQLVRFEWDFEGDGTFDFVQADTQVSPEHTYSSLGVFHPVLRVTNQLGLTAQASGTVTVIPGTLTNIATGPPDVHYFASPSLIEIDGRPAVSFTDEWTNQLFYVSAANAAGTAWNPPVTLPVSVSDYTPPCLRLVNGRPAIVYAVSLAGDLGYIRALAPDGLAWDDPVIVDTPGSDQGGIGAMISMQVISGRPAVAYTRWAEPLSLMFARASDTDGKAWGSPVEVEHGHGGCGISLAVVAGNPAISYVDSGRRMLRYVRAQDDIGSSWSAGADISSCWDRRIGTTLLVADGVPAISFLSYRLTDAWMWSYVSATDPQGVLWGDPVELSPGTEPGYLTCAAIGGSPVCTWCAQGGLLTRRAQDPAGAAWAEPRALASQAFAYGNPYASLAEVNGHAAVAFALDNDVMSYITGFD